MSRAIALKEILIFSLPIILGQIGIMLIGTGDMIIAGRFSRECLAAIGLAISIANPIQISLLGLQFSISPLLAQKRGGGEGLEDYFWTVIFYSFLVSLASGILTLLSFKIVPFFGFSENLNSIIEKYLIITSFSSVGLCLYQGIKEFFQSMEKTMIANLIALLAAGINFALNYALVFGKFGMPQLNEEGLAWASLLIRSLMGFLFFLLAYRWWYCSFRVDWIFMKEIWKVGAPISMTLFFEIMAFCSVTLLVGKFAEIQTAANNLALNLGSLAFMIPLSISAAVSVKIGHSYGERNKDAILKYSQVSLFSSFISSIMLGLLFYFFPITIMSLYTQDTLVLEWGAKILFWVACFQLFDGAQVTLAGILRGLSVTRPASLAVFVGYWIIGIPLGYYLGFFTSMQSQGLWAGLALSLAMVALMLAILFKKQFNQIEF